METAHQTTSGEKTNVVDDCNMYNAVLAEEMKLISAGYESGLIAGQNQGLKEGISNGRKKGIEIAQELGYYFGFCLTLRMHSKNNLVLKHPKACILLEEIISFAQNCEKCDFLLLEMLVKIRSQFKQALSILKVSSDKNNPTVHQNLSLTF